MKSKLLMILSLILIIEVSDFKHQRVEADVDEGIKEKGILDYKKTYRIIIKFSNIIYEEKGKQLKIPIFQGDLGDISYDEIVDYCRKKKYLEPDAVVTSFVIKGKKRQMTKTFHEFLKFYKSNILKDTDLDRPGYNNDACCPEIYYDFIIDGVPLVLWIRICRDNCNSNELKEFKYNSIFDIKLNEDFDAFFYDFYINYTTKEFHH